MKIYNLVILIVDIFTLFVKWFYFTIESIVLLFVTKTEKDVKDDIVLVRNLNIILKIFISLRTLKLIE